MNADVYLFGDLGNGYTQYIDDNSRELFKSIASKSKANSQLVVHRDDTLMYYSYVRRLQNEESSNNRYIGISYVLNNRFIRDLDGLFAIFEGAITTIVSRGVILEYTDNGNIVVSISKLYNAKSEFAHISAYLKNELDSFMAGKNDTLPPLDYSINTSEIKTFTYNDAREEIISALSTIPTVYIYKDENYESAESKSFANKLQQLNKENIELKAENAKVLREKKRTTIVTVLVIILAVGFIAILSLVDSSNQKTRQISTLKRDKTNLSQHVDALQRDSVWLENQWSSTKYELNVQQRRAHRLQSDSTKLANENNELRNDLATANKNIGAYRQTIEQKDRQIAEKDRTISNLKSSNSAYSSSSNTNSSNTNSSYSSSSYSSLSYSVGASTNQRLDGHDKSSTLWLYSKRALRINYFYVRPDKSGYITIGLYNQSGKLVSSYRAYVSYNQWNKVNPNFELSGNTKYYLAITETDGILLGYHSSSSSEYKKYQRGALQILGYCSKGISSYQTNFYQYFYSINYSLKN